jgi:ABC-type amino acid transport substrate-binding protein/ABC-type amino acid transport system permease subunit
MKKHFFTLLAVGFISIMTTVNNGNAQNWSKEMERVRSNAMTLCKTKDYRDNLNKILCEGKIKIGVRNGYLGFAITNQNERSGYDIDVARLVAESLGVESEFVNVSPVTRISSLSAGETDLVIATMGHTSKRDENAWFIRPHYYSSQTIVVGPRKVKISSWEDMIDKTVCTTVGNYANSILVPRVARVMLFDTPARLISNLKSGACTFIAQDDSVLNPALNIPEIAAIFETKLGFAEIPWGMAVAPEGSDQLAKLLEKMSRKLHKEGEFLKLAKQNSIVTSYLERMQRQWSQNDCLSIPSNCVSAPLTLTLEPGPFKKIIETGFDWVNSNLNVFYSKFAWGLFTNGIKISIIAVIGVLLATCVLSLFFALCLTSDRKMTKMLLKVVLAVFQSSPPILILVFIATIATNLFNYSQFVALLVAIIAIGLLNGAFAGQALSEAYKSLEDANRSLNNDGLKRWRKSVVIAAPQLQAFMANATRGISAASFVGVADLTNSLNDITSFSRNASLTYWVLLIFYILVVIIVVKICEFLRQKIELVDQKA